MSEEMQRLHAPTEGGEFAQWHLQKRSMASQEHVSLQNGAIKIKIVDPTQTFACPEGC